jgi:glucan phosphoethanolaminetransferase (alkaline phosphatase superfamily)
MISSVFPHRHFRAIGHKLYQHKEYWIAFCFTAYLITTEAVFFRVWYIDSFKKLLVQHAEQMDALRSAALFLTVTISLILTFLLLWIPLRSGGLVRLAAFALFSIAMMYEYTYFKALDRFSVPEDMIIAARFFDTTLYIDTVRSYFNSYSLLPIAIFGTMLYVTRLQKRLKNRLFFITCIIIVVLNVQIYRHWYLGNQIYPTIAVDNFYRTGTFAVLRAATSTSPSREAISYTSASKPTNNIVVVIDESVRADHLSLNGYHRRTTPFLEELSARGLLHNWGEAASGSTATWHSNLLILTGLNTLPDKEGQIDRLPTIFQYAKAMGYTTYYLDTSSSVFWNGDLNDLKYIDHWENQQTLLNGPLYDADIFAAHRIRGIVEHEVGHFIVLNKRGVHTAYNRAFPPTATVWEPVMSTSEYDPKHYQQIANSYDNAIHYNLETFFRALIDPEAPAASTVILYTSDHGQTLAEDGATWSHSGSTRNEANVPLFLISNSRYDFDTSYRASHSNILPTLLDLMSFPEAERNHAYNLSLFRATMTDSQPRRYSHGNLDGSGGGGIKMFDPPR